MSFGDFSTFCVLPFVFGGEHHTFDSVVFFVFVVFLHELRTPYNSPENTAVIANARGWRVYCAFLLHWRGLMLN